MPFLALLTRDVDIERAVRRPLHDRHLVARAGGWDRLLHLIRERPVTCVLVDETAVPRAAGAAGAIAELRASFPSVSLILIARPEMDPFELLRLGRAGVDQLILVRVDDLERDVAEVVGKALATGTEALVARAMSAYLPARALGAVRLSLEGAQHGWSAGGLARIAGLSRPHLSVCLKAAGLPSVGHLLVWARLLHAARWLMDPGRSAESVARQLDYSSGAAFRRALRSYTGATPTRVIEAGGLSFLLEHFMARCGLRPARGEGLSVA
jgi:AraC-like DNA-binding protein